MKLFTYCILLLLLIGLVPVAAADASHSFSGVHDDTVTNSFVYGGDVKDTVDAQLTFSDNMLFYWADPSNDLRRRAGVYLISGSDSYYDIVTNTDEQGQWSVSATEFSYGNEAPKSTSAQFKVAALPEFSIGSFISLIFAGVLYFMMRRTVKGSVNVG